MLRIHEIRLRPDEETGAIPGRIAQRLGIKPARITAWNIARESVDARDKSDVKFVYSVDFEIDDEPALLKRAAKLKIEKVDLAPYGYPATGTIPLRHRPVVIGLGPCGLFAALALAEKGFRPIVLERGRPMEERTADVQAFWQHGILRTDSNVQFGEGGAGAFSDGKLTTQIRDPRVRKVLEELVLAGGPPDILYKQKPHVGTDILRRAVVSMREKIVRLGGEVLFGHKLAGIGDGRLLVDVQGGEAGMAVPAEAAILAVGHSARDTVAMLYGAGLEMEQKPFSIGVRIEHPQLLIDRAQYGAFAGEGRLGAAEYKLSFRSPGGRGVYTFCMCPGGHVIAAASEEGGVVTNGMSYHSRKAPNANSALLVDVRTEDFGSAHPLAGIEFQREYERKAFEAGGGGYSAPAQRVGDFLGTGTEGSAPMAIEPSYRPGIAWVDLSACLPGFAIDALREALPSFGRKIRGFDHPGAVLTGVETRSSSPVRIRRDETMRGSIRILYPAGEGAGYAGGIVSAAVDGIRAAEAIIERHAPPDGSA